ncbi:MAG TPA: PAS domain S-box protein, partial [Caldilineaceae bacterium]|nr:PAS domain S-box protein [Caldilineaceae bacterium]
MSPLSERRASIDALARAVAQSPDGIAVLAWEGEILYANPAWMEMHGYSAEESIGRRIQDLYPGEALARHADETVRRLAEQDSYEVEIRHAKRDGTPFQAWLITTLLRDEDGKPSGFVITARDVTEWNRLREALEAEKSRLEQQYRRQEALANIEFAINEPSELAVALQRIVDVVTDLLPAPGGASLLLWDDVNKTYTISASTVPSQLPSLAARRIRSQGGATRWIIEQKEPVVVADTRTDCFGANPLLTEFGLRAYAGVPILAENHCLGVLYALDKQPRECTANDISFLTTLAARAGTAIGKVKLYEQLRETNILLHNQATDLAVRNADLDAFAHSVAHDLKNPLTSIMGYAEMLLDDYDLLSDEERREFLGYIAQRSVKMRQIVDELLLMSQLRNREVQLVPVDMRGIVSEASSRVDEDRRQRRAILHVPAVWPKALGYPQWLEEVWTNYMSNAIKYGGQPPEVWLGADEWDNGTIRFWVKDNGGGLSAEDQKRLFLPFT